MKIRIYKPDKFLYFFKNGKTTTNMNMKTIVLIFVITLTGICSFGQSRQDQTQILQKCIDLPEIQNLFPTDAHGDPQSLRIMQHTVSFSTEMQITKFGMPVLLLTKDQIYQSSSKAFFRFDSFQVNENQANVAFDFHYNRDQQVPGRVRVKLLLQKANDQWTIINETQERI